MYSSASTGGGNFVGTTTTVTLSILRVDDPPLLDLNRLDNRASSAIASTDSLNAALSYTEQQASTLAFPNALLTDDEDAIAAITLTFATTDANDTLELAPGLNNPPAVTRTGATTTLAYGIGLESALVCLSLLQSASVYLSLAPWWLQSPDLHSSLP